MKSQRFKAKDGEIMIVSYDYQVEEIVLDFHSKEDHAWQNLNSARATHQPVLFCSDDKLWEDFESKEVLKT